jgi:preprotein translocase subunit SecG
METFLIVVQALLSLALIAVIMMQSGKEEGLSGALSGNNDTYLGKNGKSGLDKMLASSTKWVALAWIVLTLILSLI